MTRTLTGMTAAGLVVLLAAGQTNVADPPDDLTTAAPAALRVHVPADRSADGCPVLRASLPEVRAQGQPLYKLLEFLAELETVNLVVDWQALGKAGVQRETPISCDLHGLTFREGLELILDQVRPEEESLAYDCTGNVVRISTCGELDRPYVFRIYDVRELTRAIERWDHERIRTRIHLAAEAARAWPTKPRNREDACGGEGGSYWTEPESILASIVEGDTDEKLLEILSSSVVQDEWIVNGGSSAMRSAGGVLLVHAPLYAHAQLQSVLETLQLALTHPGE